MNPRSPEDLRKILVTTAMLLAFVLLYYLMNSLTCSPRQGSRVRQVKIGNAIVIAEVHDGQECEAGAE